MAYFQELTAGIIFLRGKDLEDTTQLRTGSSATAALIYAETEDGMNNPPTGSMYLSTAGTIWFRIATTPAATDWIPLDLEAVETAYIYVAKSGNDTTGNGSANAPYLTITQALSVVTSARKTIMVAPGEYEEVGAIVWPTTVSGIQLIGTGNRFETVISAAAGDEVITLTPGVQTSTFELTIQNIQIDHDTSGQDGIAATNDSMTKKLNIYLGNVGFAGDGADNAIVCTHGDTGNAIRIYWDGGNGDCESGIDLAQANDGDRFYVDNVIFSGDDIDAGTNVAGTIKMRYCQIGYRTFTGGGASTVVTMAWCIRDNSGTLGAVDAADVETNSSITGSVIVGT